jgi:hypothetical protein
MEGNHGLIPVTVSLLAFPLAKCKLLGHHEIPETNQYIS